MISEMHEKLSRWAEWSARGGLMRGLWYARCTFADGGAGASLVDPVMDEASYQLHLLIGKLPDDLREAVNAFYLGRGQTEDRARTLRISVRTMYRRVEHAQFRLQQEMSLASARVWPVKCTFGGS